MRKTIASALLRLLALFCAGLFVSSASFADPPTSLMVVRAADNSLWKATCVANTCSAFTNFPGFFGSQPTVSWDDSILGYVITGTAANNTLWRSTFSSSGAFNNDWVQLPGLAASPPGAGSRALHDWNSQDGSEGSNVRLTDSANGSVVNIVTMTTDPTYPGYYQCTATAMVSILRANSTGNSVAFFGLSPTSGAFDVGGASKWTAIDLPPGTPAGQTTIPISVTAYFGSGSSPKAFYNVAEWAGANVGATITVRQPAMHCEYYKI